MKAFVITIFDEPLSVELSNECIKSCDKFGLQVNKFSGVYKHNLEQVWNENNLSLYVKLNDTAKTSGVKGCFLSHFLLWKKCLELNETIIIFEHDAVMIRDLPDIKNSNFDVLNLDYASREIPDYYEHIKNNFGLEIKSWHKESKIGYSRYKKSCIKGIHAYVVRPNGASKLIDFAYKEGVFPADVHVNSLVCDLKYTNTSYFMINPKYWQLPKDHPERKKPGSTESFTVKDWI